MNRETLKAKKTVACGKCENLVEILAVGLSNEVDLRCGKFDIPVSEADGCTFGKEGERKYRATQPADIDLGHAAKVEGSSLNG